MFECEEDILTVTHLSKQHFQAQFKVDVSSHESKIGSESEACPIGATWFCN